jgi:hypothetical protein
MIMMKSELWAKRMTQSMLKEFRKAGYQVDKLGAGYQIIHEGQLIFKAMVGGNAYLVRYDKRLLTEA